MHLLPYLIFIQSYDLNDMIMSQISECSFGQADPPGRLGASLCSLGVGRTPPTHAQARSVSYYYLPAPSDTSTEKYLLNE